jgi:hypothetical protein
MTGCIDPKIGEGVWEIEDVIYYDVSDNLRVKTTYDIDNVDYYADAEYTQEMDFSTLISFEGKSDVLLDDFSIVGTSMFFDTVDPPLDEEKDQGIRVFFDTDTWFYQVYSDELSVSVMRFRIGTPEKTVVFEQL